MRRLVLLWAVSTLREAAWAPTAVFLTQVVASRVFHAYIAFPPLDIPMHLLGGVAIAFFFHRGLVNAASPGLLGPIHPVTHRLLVFSLVGTTTVFWECAEFVSDRYFGTHAQLDLADTMKDMCMGILGCLLFLVALSHFARVRLVSAERLGAKNGT
jgi:hypothetical protein